MTAMIFTFFLFIAGVAVVSVLSGGEEGAPAFVLIWVAAVVTQAWWVLLRIPQRIEVLSDGLRFVARTRTVVIPWGSLRSVSSSGFDPFRQMLLWEGDNRKIRTWTAYDGLHRLLTMVEQRAPSAQIRNL